MSSGKKFQSDLLIIVSVLTYSFILSFFTIAKHNSFSTYAWDLGIFNQGFWTTTFKDQIFKYTCEKHLVESGSFFGIHFSPILFTLIPIYYLFPSPSTLLIAQSLILGLSAVPVYKSAQRRFTHTQSCLIGILYLMNPALHGINSYDFHVQAFLPLLLNYLIYFTYDENDLGIKISVILALAVQEQVFYLILAYTLFMVVRRLLTTDGLSPRTNAPIVFLVLLLAVSWKYLSGTVINYFNPDIPDHLRAGQHFAVLGVSDPASIPFHALLNLGSVIRALVFQWYDKLVYILAHFTPYLYFASQGMVLLIPTLPWFTISLLSNYPPYYRIGFQYSAYLVPFIYNGFLHGLNAEKKPAKSFTKKLRVLTVLVIATSLALSPLSPFTKGFYLSPSYQKPDLDIRNQRIHETLTMIPNDASILTQDNLFPHLSCREDAYVMIPSTFRDVKTWKDAMTWITTRNTEYIMMDLESDPHGTGKYLLDIAKRENYGLVAFYDNTYLYKKDHGTAPIQYEPVNITYSVKELVPQNVKNKQYGNSTYGFVFSYYNQTLNSRTLWHGPYSVMPKGNFTVQFKVKTLDNTLDEELRFDVFTNKTIMDTMSFKEQELVNNTWSNMSLNFSLPDVVYDLEFRAFLDGNGTQILLDSIRLTQTG